MKTDLDYIKEIIKDLDYIDMHNIDIESDNFEDIKLRNNEIYELFNLHDYLIELEKNKF